MYRVVQRPNTDSDWRPHSQDAASSDKEEEEDEQLPIDVTSEDSSSTTTSSSSSSSYSSTSSSRTPSSSSEEEVKAPGRHKRMTKTQQTVRAAKGKTSARTGIVVKKAKH